MWFPVIAGGLAFLNSVRNVKASKERVNREQEVARANYNTLREQTGETERLSGLTSPMAYKKIDQSQEKTMKNIKGAYDMNLWDVFFGTAPTMLSSIASYGSFSDAKQQTKMLNEGSRDLASQFKRKKNNVDLLRR